MSSSTGDDLSPKALMTATSGSSPLSDGGLLTPAYNCKLYKRRWPILLLFVLYSTSNAFQWIQYSIINNVIVRYYDVTSFSVDWTSMIYMVLYIPLIFPAAWILDKKGLRVAVMLGSFGTMLGSWIKVGSLSPDRFYVTFIGQTVSAASQIFILGIPAKLAAVWFGPGQVSSACAIGVFGNQLGCALGFLVPPSIVKNRANLDDITHDLSIMFYGQAAITTALFLTIAFVFQNEPKLPPSPAQAALRQAEPEHYLLSIVRLLKNRHYILLLVTYGMNVGVFYAISTLLNQVVLIYYPTAEEDAGRIGLVIVLAGMLGSVVCGVWLDKTHRFKGTTLAVYVLSVAGMVAYTFTLPLGYISVVYITAGLLGFFMTGYLPVGFEFAAEITYPESEGTSSGLLNASAQFFGIIFTIADGKLLNGYGDRAANLALAAMLLLGSILTALIKSDLRRQRAHQQHQPVDRSQVAEKA
ncbi:feline leukemia virus subgroup C receptor-related protein 1-like isoform X1 [Pollicipes pollicipes]|uniref:feline leukemia virus subgroup C receptor-related protein 1-like isoform X1 n=1 Tax=Pollicipes pollicipes TaxID=41117 RepID=UPI0018858D27|nr:feline leukemia virus subgroup C receptor-related protein 1-like isoform X1 [Pollicipes pollicipes]XP_037068045.1 feline leukemia virus subgroup C receptor-related protein 1-like isoform X1 [Pollicipes pollicipes]